MDLSDLKTHYGSIPEAARALGLVRQAVYQWKGGIPALRQIQIERATGGKLRADLECYEPKLSNESHSGQGAA